jgi:hypothetical protein
MIKFGNASQFLREQSGPSGGLDEAEARLKELLFTQIVMPQSELPGALNITRQQAAELVTRMAQTHAIEILPPKGGRHAGDPLIKLSA